MPLVASIRYDFRQIVQARLEMILGLRAETTARRIFHLDFRREIEMDHGTHKIPELVGQLFQTVQALNDLFPNRPFTPDGHLVGSIGEVVAAETYGLILEKCSREGFDARTEDGQTVEIKLTGGSSVSISSGPKTPEILVVLKLDSRAGFEEVYNGAFPLDLWRSKKPSKRQIVSLSLSALRKINPKLLTQASPLEKLNSFFKA